MNHHALHGDVDGHSVMLAATSSRNWSPMEEGGAAAVAGIFHGPFWWAWVLQAMLPVEASDALCSMAFT